MKRTVCAACGSPDLDQFLDLGTSPVADAYTATPDAVCPRYPLQVAVCGKCHLVQLLEVLDGKALFGTGYSFYSSASAPLSAYHADYAASVRERAFQGVLEIGCNDGDFLRHFQHGCHLGIDPAAGPVTVARARGLNVREGAFGSAMAAELPRDFGLIVANHVLAHVEDVADFLAGIALVMRDDAVAMIEVQYLPDLLIGNAFDLVYHEHRNFFSLTSLEQAANRHGLRVIDAELTDRQGGSLRVALAKKAGLPPARRVYRIKRSEIWLNGFSAYAGMQGRAERIRDRLRALIAAERRPVVGYGAPAKATTLFAFCGLDVKDIAYVTDTTAAKQGRYVPGTGIPIVAPDHRTHTTRLVTAHNYLPQILRQESQFSLDGGRWIVPLPVPVVLP